MPDTPGADAGAPRHDRTYEQTRYVYTDPDRRYTTIRTQAGRTRYYHLYLYVCRVARELRPTHFAVKRQGHVLTFRFGSVADSGGSPCSSWLHADRNAPREGRAPKHSEAVASTSDASALGMWLQLGRRSE